MLEPIQNQILESHSLRHDNEVELFVLDPEAEPDAAANKKPAKTL
jgi:hypothetical protein